VPSSDPARRAVVTGWGAITPIGNDAETYWSNLLAGVPGAIAILPFVAAYPAIERLFLAEKFAPDTVRKHEQMSAK